MKISNPRSSDKSAYIDVDIDDGDVIYTFCCMPGDPEEHGADLYKRALSGEFGKVKGIK